MSSSIPENMEKSIIIWARGWLRNKIYKQVCNFFFNFIFYFWLQWVFVVASRDYSLAEAHKVSLQRLPVL